MQQQTEISSTGVITGTGSVGANGGATQSNTEHQTFSIPVIQNNLKDLESLYITKHAADENYAASTKAVAERAGVLPAVLRKLVKAVAESEFDKHKVHAEQLSMVFDVDWPLLVFGREQNAE